MFPPQGLPQPGAGGLSGGGSAGGGGTLPPVALQVLLESYKSTGYTFFKICTLSNSNHISILNENRSRFQLLHLTLHFLHLEFKEQLS